MTLVTRPRRFGKTLLLNTVDRFLSNQYQNQSQWFEGLEVWNDPALRKVQGTLPVIFLSFADVKERNYQDAVRKLAELLFRLYGRYRFLLESDVLSEEEKAEYRKVLPDMEQARISGALNILSEYLYRYYHKKVIILLDEYDTPMQEAYVNGYWKEITQLFRSLFNSALKTNPYMDRALMTGITRVSRESMFSDLNNLKVISTSTDRYTTAFGFTEAEVFSAMDTYGYRDKEGVRRWYDGFVFGSSRSIYNPWSIINYLQEGKLKPYWSNTSGNALASKLIREGNRALKTEFETILKGETIHSRIDEQVVFGEIQGKASSVWSLLLASGYLKALHVKGDDYELALTNYEVAQMFEKLVQRWFDAVEDDYNDFVNALLRDDIEEMNHYMNRVALATFSSFDSGTHPSDAEPERFYHGFVLGLLVELKDRYLLTSNRESGFGRYDVMLEPRNPNVDDAYILEFKVNDPKEEPDLQDTVKAAHAQITEKKYAQSLVERGIPEERIHVYGFAFRGKEVLIG